MRVIIFEDEARAASHLQRLLQTVAPGMEVAIVIETVREACDYLSSKPDLDLIFSDVQHQWN